MNTKYHRLIQCFDWKSVPLMFFQVQLSGVRTDELKSGEEYRGIVHADMSFFDGWPIDIEVNEKGIYGWLSRTYLSADKKVVVSMGGGPYAVIDDYAIIPLNDIPLSYDNMDKESLYMPMPNPHGQYHFNKIESSKNDEELGIYLQVNIPILNDEKYHYCFYDYKTEKGYALTVEKIEGLWFINNEFAMVSPLYSNMLTFCFNRCNAPTIDKLNIEYSRIVDEIVREEAIYKEISQTLETHIEPHWISEGEKSALPTEFELQQIALNCYKQRFRYNGFIQHFYLGKSVIKHYHYENRGLEYLDIKIKFEGVSQQGIHIYIKSLNKYITTDAFINGTRVISTRNLYSQDKKEVYIRKFEPIPFHLCTGESNGYPCTTSSCVVVDDSIWLRIKLCAPHREDVYIDDEPLNKANTDGLFLTCYYF